MPSLLPFGVAFGLTVIAIILLKPLAIKINWIDMPGGRKSHHGNIPLIGGVSMFLGISFALLTLDVSLSTYRALIACTGLLVITGFLDDFHELTPRSRLFVQIFVSALMIYWGKVNLITVGNLFSLGQINLGYLMVPVTLIAALTVINAVNMTDGVDGLAGSITLVEFFYLSWLCHRAGLVIDKQIIQIILSALLAFLCFNFPFKERASIFMGDSGSMMLGFLLVWFCIYLSQPPHMAARPVTFLWIMAIPLWDISNVVIRRLIRGFSPFKPDRGHVHHYLIDKGFSSLHVTLLITSASVLMGFIGMLGEKYQLKESYMFLGFVICFMIYFLGFYLFSPRRILK